MKQQFILFLIILFSVNSFGQEQLEVFFDFNKSEINESAKQKLETWIAANNDVEVSKIYGYCDWIGSNPYNDTLSLKRVDAVYKFLKTNAITGLDNFEIKGFGKNFKQSKIQAENRKVIVFYSLKKEISPDVKLVVMTQGVDNQSIEFPILEEEKLASKFDKAKIGDLVRINKINFYFNSEKIMEESLPILDELLQIMVSNPKMKIEIHGHICCNQDPKDIKLSSERARIILKYLIKNGVADDRMNFKGYGSNNPIYHLPEKNEKERVANRRVEILILDK